ncbi:MAG: hypothetical protein LBV80_07880 [Deltaproteobacteria bacterium]|jgi:hypothetical protein|nr:hypothetical protein [Deltaproteobacteria bacterium]
MNLPALPDDFMGEITAKKFPFAVILLSSRAKAWFVCRNICSKAPFFIENENAILAMFGNNYESIALLGNALAVARGWKNVFYFMDGEFIPNTKESTHWMPCFRGSNYAQDLMFHCIGGSLWQFEPDIIVPCRYIHPDTFKYGYLTELKDMAITAGRRAGVYGCPHYRKIINSMP